MYDPGEAVIKEGDLATIEAKMAELVARKEAVVRADIAKTDALKMFGERGETYKCELISELRRRSYHYLYARCIHRLVSRTALDDYLAD